MSLEWIHPDELRNHPTNLSIYGDTPDPELLASVKEHGVFDDHPIGYVQDGDFKTIVSGHRRNQAARIAKLEMVPVVRLKDIEGDELAIRERIILSNKQRIKTEVQLAKEAAALAAIIEERAKANSSAQLKQNTEKPEESSDCTPRGAVGRTEKVVGESLGVGKKRAKNLITAGKALNEAESLGETEKADEIKEGLKKSAAAGARAAKPDKPSKNGAVIADQYDEKKIEKPIGVIRRELDERLKVFPGTDRLYRVAKHALVQLNDAITNWRNSK